METQNEIKANEIAMCDCQKHYKGYGVCDNYKFHNKKYCARKSAALEAMEWKDEQFKGFLFELALKITTPKTDLDKALASAFPMAGLDTVEDVLASLQNEWFDYQNKGTILNN